MTMEKIGILTGGGDCPGLNAVIRAVVRRSHALGFDVLGIKNGWAGLIHGFTEPLTDFSVTGILPRGGTILGTSRTNPFKQMEHFQKLKANWQKFDLNYLVAVGGEDTLGVAHKLFKQEDYPIVGVPKTIDNDLAGTDYTFGFDTAVQIVTEAIEFGHAQMGGIGDWLGGLIEQKTGIETRVTVLGHVQRGGTPTAYDRVLATRFGLKAVELIQQKQFGYMASLCGTEIVAVPIEEALTQKLLDPKVFDDAAVFFG
jgi:6-phosphofructokinase